MRRSVFVSATPAAYELEKSSGEVVEQVVRPTGLVDPRVEVRPAVTQVDDLLSEITLTVKKEERVLVTTLTKRMAGGPHGLPFRARRAREVPPL